MNATEPLVYNIVGAEGKDELFASLQLGDNQHRRNFEVRVSAPNNRISFLVKLLIDQLQREDGSGNCWNFKGYAMPSGRWVPVMGFIRTSNGTGTIKVRAKKHCTNCNSTGTTQEARCKRCGNILDIVEVPSLF